MIHRHLAILVFAVTASLFGAGAPAQQLPPAEYGIKDDSAPTGSNIRRYAVRTSGVPLNRRYNELSDDERAIVHSWYERIEPGDEPPFPAEGLKPIHDAVRRGQSKFLVNGEMFLLATVGASGQVEMVKVFRSPDAQVTKFVSTVLMLTKFKPAVCGGNPCRMEYPFTFTFKVE